MTDPEAHTKWCDDNNAFYLGSSSCFPCSWYHCPHCFPAMFVGWGLVATRMGASPSSPLLQEGFLACRCACRGLWMVKLGPETKYLCGPLHHSIFPFLSLDLPHRHLCMSLRCQTEGLLGGHFILSALQAEVRCACAWHCWSPGCGAVSCAEGQ